MLAYFPQVVYKSDINKLNKLVFIVTACCLKNTIIHNLDTLLKVSEYTCDTSRIMREAPEFEPYLLHSRILNFAIMIFRK